MQNQILQVDDNYVHMWIHDNLKILSDFSKNPDSSKTKVDY